MTPIAYRKGDSSTIRRSARQNLTMQLTCGKIGTMRQHICPTQPKHTHTNKHERRFEARPCVQQRAALPRRWT